MSVRRDVFDVAGGFQTGLGRDGDNAAGCEETEFFIRAKATLPKQKIVYEPDASVRHHVTAVRCTWIYFLSRCCAEGKSKAAIVEIVGNKDGLSSENEFVFKVLPMAVYRNLVDALRGDIVGVARAIAIIAGLTTTAAAYFSARIGPKSGKSQEQDPFRPIEIIDWDLDKHERASLLDCVRPAAFDGGAFCLLRSNGRPVGIKEVRINGMNRDCVDFTELEEFVPKSMNLRSLEIPSGQHKPWISAVIATRDRPNSLLRCIRSLLAQSYTAMDIIIVDNAPKSSATEDLIANVFGGSEQVKYIREQRPGLSFAHNTGLARAQGEIVAFTDDDVVADPDWVAAIAVQFARSNTIGCVTGMILPAELDTRAQYWTERHGGFGKGVVRRVFDLNDNRSTDPLFPYNAGTFGSGANMAFRRDALSKIGTFDAALGAGTPARGGDDLASFVAIVEAGYQLVYEPNAIVWHFHRRTEAGIRKQAYGYGVGLGAYVTKQILENPRRLMIFARMLPAALNHLVSDASEKMQRLPDDYPSDLIWRERFGILMGPLGYFKGRYRVRRSGLTTDRLPALANLDTPAE
ncbi:MAG: glycosyltransferase [Roseibium sp.]